MNCRSAIHLILACAAAGAVHAQEKPQVKPATPKVEKPATPKAEKPKVLIFEPPPTPPGAAGEPAPKPAAILDGPAQVVGTFFGSLQQGKVDEAYATLTKGSKIAEKPDEVKQLKAKTVEAIEVFGSIHGYDLVESRVIGRRLVRATYVSLGKIFPLRWRFYFYKPEDIWRLIDLRVDDKLTGIFDESEEPKAPEGAVPQP